MCQALDMVPAFRGVFSVIGMTDSHREIRNSIAKDQD